MAQRYVGRKRAYGSLTTDLENFVRVSDERMLAVMRQSLQDVVENAQVPVAKGGRMRVDTGFLRSSGQPSIGSMPSGATRGDPKGKYDFTSGTLIEILAKMKLGDVFFFGWTAEYARYRELYDGFLEAALAQWGRIVAFNTDTLRERIK